MTFTKFPIPTSEADPDSITVGPDGALWFTESQPGKIGRITTSGSVTEYPLPTVNAFPSNITSGSDGALWFTFSGSGNDSTVIGRITTAGNFTPHPFPEATAGAYATSIAAGPDGALWYGKEGLYLSDSSDDKFGRITTGGTISEYPVPVPSGDYAAEPTAEVAGPDGNLWYTVETNFNFAPDYVADGGLIARVTTGGTVTEYPLAVSNTVPSAIAAGPDGALWFTQNNQAATSTGNEIGRITTSGSVTEYPVNSNTLYGITSGPDGAVWFNDSFGCISRIATGGSVTQYALPAAYDVSYGLTTGPDGAIWFLDSTGNFIGRLVPGTGTAVRTRRLTLPPGKGPGSP